MTEQENKLIEIIFALCDAVNDSPCGCDACPYANTLNDGQCEVYDTIAMVRKE